MAYRYTPGRRTVERGSLFARRLHWLAAAFALAGVALVARLFQLQVVEGRTYRVLASDQHEIEAALIPKRGTVYVRDRYSGTLHAIAADRDAWQVYAVRREMDDPAKIGKEVAELLNVPEAELSPKFTSPTATYFVVAKDVPLDVADRIRTRRLPGIGTVKVQTRSYPEEGIGGHVLGFVVNDDHEGRVGRYGVEGFYQELLGGKAGSVLAEKDAAGRRLPIGTLELQEARDGSDLVLTIDRTIQYTVCTKIREAVERFEAESGSVVVLDPNTGAVLAMCSVPDFDPANFGKVASLSVLNNPAIFYQYEPGSVFKPFTMAAGLDGGKITTRTTYTDTGEETMDGFTVRNSDKRAHGVQSMTQVLEKSLNTGTIFVERQLGRDLFRDYVEKFGFGERVGIGLQTEGKGNIASLNKKGKIFAATASYGQGISVTPLQLAAGYAALGNGGKLMRPYVVEEIIHPDGKRETTKPEVVRQAIHPRTSRLISAMMVNVVEKGHGKRAGVPGYYVAGKTGTAQVPNPKGEGYLEDVTIGSFAGYAPADNPRFVMLVKIDKPKTVKFAEASAAPVFGELAKFLLHYLQVPPERPIVEPPPPPLPAATSTPAASTSTNAR